MKLTEDDIYCMVGAVDGLENYQIIINGFGGTHLPVKIKQQILENQEKARKWDDKLRGLLLADESEKLKGLPVPEECNILNRISLENVAQNQKITEIVLSELNLRETGQEYDNNPDVLLDKIKGILNER